MDEEQNRIGNATALAPGYRFYPTEEELLCFYLQNKLHNRREDDIDRVIPVAHLYQFDPWQLPQISGERSVRDSEQWFFFCPRHEREAHGGRPTRTTPSGYWKATGSPGLVYSSSNRPIGIKKTMVFYRGRAPVGTKTKWKMNEYRAFNEDHGATTVSNSIPEVNSEFSVCRVYTKLGCLRSFDRRPSADPQASSSRRMLEAVDSDGNPPVAMQSRSLDSSSFEDSGEGSSRTGGDADLKMLEDIQWDSLDWD